MIQILKFIWKDGFSGLKKVFIRKIILSLSPPNNALSKTYYIYIPKKYGSQYLRNERILDVNWFIPAFNEGSGSGGHLNIFRMVHFLEKLGIKNNLVIVESNHLTTIQSKRVINEDYIPVNAEIFEGRREAKPTLISMATEWRTAYPVRDFIGSPLKTYFVQDYESLFYPPGTDSALAEATYKFGFYGITAGDWIKDTLEEKYQMPCESFGFSYDKHLYSAVDDVNIPQNTWKQKKPRVFFYLRTMTPRRGAYLGLLALGELKKRMPEVEILIAGEDNSNMSIDFEVTNLGLLQLSQLHDIYKSVDLALVLSFTNLSLLPLELMASNCTLLINEGPNNRWGLNEAICSFCDPTIESITDKMLELLKNHDLRNRLRKNAVKYVATTSWEKEAEKVFKILTNLQKKYLNND